MKNRIAFLITALIFILTISACQSKHDYNFTLPAIPEGYMVDKTLYMAEGDGIYVFIQNNMLDYETISVSICNGDAEVIKKQYEESSIIKENPQDYAAVQNVLGIAEIYLGNYNRAYEYFNNTISFIHNEEFPEKSKILTVLYNNAGAVTVNLNKNATNDKRLQKAAELCTDPYMGMVIAVNLTGRVKTFAPKKEIGVMIQRSKELIEKEAEINNSPNFVKFAAAKYMALGYMFTGQENKAIEIYDKYITEISEEPEYNLLKASLLSYRGYCYDYMQKYENAIEDFQNSIILAEKTVDENSRQLAISYNRMGVSYIKEENWECGLAYNEMAIPGNRYSTATDKGILYWNVGYACWQLGQYEKSKKYLLISYINKQKVIEDLGHVVGEDYDGNVKKILFELYQMEKDLNIPFDEWLSKESRQYKSEEISMRDCE